MTNFDLIEQAVAAMSANPLSEYLSSEFVEEFEPETDNYDTVNDYYRDWLIGRIEESTQFSQCNESQALEIDEAIEEWVAEYRLKDEQALLEVLDDMEDKSIAIEYRLSNNGWHGLWITDVFEVRSITAPDFIPRKYLENGMHWLSDLASYGAEGGNFLVCNAEIWEVAHKSKDLDDFLFDNDWQPTGEDLTDTVVKAVWFAAQTWAMNVLSELGLDY